MNANKPLIAICLLCVHLCLFAVAQRRTPTDYSKFLHNTPKHQSACNTCHKIPTKDWAKTSAFPDITDYPGHDACVSCHRPEFFHGARPPICSVCHSKTSPRDEARFAFRNPASKQQFKINFPHDKHQDVIALLRFAHPPQRFYNCEVCHGRRDDTFKAVPAGHSACFNCHWKSQQPVADNCKDCHNLTTPYTAMQTPRRISPKFKHEGGGETQKKHEKECTACHIYVTRDPTVRKRKQDVPITACTECHESEGLRRDISAELKELKKNPSYTCQYCHGPNFGNLDPPASHFLLAGMNQFKRQDIKK